jgi:hypothetical protein
VKGLGSYSKNKSCIIGGLKKNEKRKDKNVEM